MATTNKWNGNGLNYSREEDTTFLELFSRALEESIRDSLIEVQKREQKDEQRK